MVSHPARRIVAAKRKGKTPKQSPNRVSVPFASLVAHSQASDKHTKDSDGSEGDYVTESETEASDNGDDDGDDDSDAIAAVSDAEGAWHCNTCDAGNSADDFSCLNCGTLRFPDSQEGVINQKAGRPIILRHGLDVSPEHFREDTQYIHSRQPVGRAIFPDSESYDESFSDDAEHH
jgi:hypothetical protein